MKITTTKEIKDEQLECLLYTAGSGAAYWANSNLPFESCVKKIMNGESINVVDPEEEKTHILNLQIIKKGLTIMAKKYPKEFAEFISDDYDNDTGDTFLQCCLFKEVIYG